VLSAVDTTRTSSATISDAIDVSTSTQVAVRSFESVVRLVGIGPPIGARISPCERSDTDRGCKLADEFRAPAVSQPV
jgi:hypothetical protein